MAKYIYIDKMASLIVYIYTSTTLIHGERRPPNVAIHARKNGYNERKIVEM